MPEVEKLESYLADVSALHSKLILLTGPFGAGKTAILLALAKTLRGNGCNPKQLNVGSALGTRLATVANKSRPLEAAAQLCELADEQGREQILLLDNIELLFDRHLRLDPLALLKRLAQMRPVVVAWPGTVHDGRLIYAQMGHAEYQDYAATGLVHFQIND
jgi:hypothetical protein